MAVTAIPEWLRPAQVPDHFPIGRTYLYRLISDGLVKSKTLKRPGNTRGIRLINSDSLRQYIESQPEN